MGKGACHTLPSTPLGRLSTVCGNPQELVLNKWNKPSTTGATLVLPHNSQSLNWLLSRWFQPWERLVVSSVHTPRMLWCCREQLGDNLFASRNGDWIPSHRASPFVFWYLLFPLSVHGTQLEDAIQVMVEDLLAASKLGSPPSPKPKVSEANGAQDGPSFRPPSNWRFQRRRHSGSRAAISEARHRDLSWAKSGGWRIYLSSNMAGISQPRKKRRFLRRKSR